MVERYAVLTMKRKKKNEILSRPQRKGLVTKIVRRKPKKPNSARRKIIKIRISGIYKWISVPGVDTRIEKFNKILIRGGNIIDMNQIRHKIILGIYDIKGNIRKSSRSKYGIKKLI